MDFSEDRIPYRSVNEEYITERIRNEIQRQSGKVLIEQFDGEEFIEQCLIWLRYEGTGISLQEKDKLLNWLQHGVSKEIIIAYFIAQKKPEYKVYISEKKQRYYEKKLKNYEWDFSWLLDLAPETFVKACYQLILEREPDEGGFVGYCEQLYDGMPKEGVLYSIGSSPECIASKRIKNLNKYEMIFNKYIVGKQNRTIEQKAKQIIKQIVQIPRILQYLKKYLYHDHLKDDYRYEILYRSIQNIQDQNGFLIHRITLLEEEVQELRGKK